MTCRKRLLFVAIIFVVLMCITATPAMASEDVRASFDKTHVLDDLTSSTVNGKAFNLVDYPYKEGEGIKVLSVVEFAYSPKKYLRENFGLYLYLYNPGAITISGNSQLNKVQIAVSYNDNGEPNDYEKFDLRLCSAVYEGDYKGLFYKFKVVDRKGGDGKTIAERVNSNERRYDISGVEILTLGDTNAVEYSVAATYKFTGYASGYGIDANAESTLNCQVEKLRTVTLDVNQTYYRFNNGENVAKQINSCYFAVDGNLIKEYGRLQRIKAEWWEYRTTPIVITSDSDLYSALNSYIGETVTYDKNVGYFLECIDWYYNRGGLSIDNPLLLSKLAYIFNTNGDDVYDYKLSGQVLTDYIYSYSKGSSVLPIKDGKLSTDLLTENVGEGRTAGYNCIDKDADDIFTLDAYDSSSFFSWWYGLFHDVETEARRDIQPIYEVQAKDLVGTDKMLATALMIAEEDVSRFRSYCNDSFGRGQKVYLFRYAVSDYRSVPIQYRKDAVISVNQNGKAYAAYENVFLDFDIIQLTLNADGVYTVIPVVNSPADVISTITPPLENTFGDKAKKIIGIIVALILLILLAPLIPYVVKFIVWIIALPFKAIAKGIKSIGKSARRRE